MAAQQQAKGCIGEFYVLLLHKNWRLVYQFKTNDTDVDTTTMRHYATGE